MLSVNPKYTLATPVVVLQDYLAGTTQERFKAYMTEWIKCYPNKTAAQLSKSPRFMLTFLDDSMVVLNLLAQHPELLHNVEFQTKYGFIEQEIDNLRTSIKKQLDLSVLLKECQVTMDLMGMVCKGLEDLDPCVALMQEEEMSGGGEAVVTDTVATDAATARVRARQNYRAFHHISPDVDVRDEDIQNSSAGWEGWAHQPDPRHPPHDPTNRDTPTAPTPMNSTAVPTSAAT